LIAFKIICAQVKAAIWSLERGVTVVICNGMQELALTNAIAGRKIGTFFTASKNVGTPIETLAQNGTVTYERACLTDY
jgi:glutamate 5-kinase